MTIKRLILACFILIGIQSFGQNPTNYTLRNSRERIISFITDSMLRIPRYNGTPTGVRVGETSTIDGAIAMDTTNHLFYMFSGNAWVRIAKYSELGSGAVDSIWRVAGQDSIKWRRNGTTFAIKDSTGTLIRFGLEDNSGSDRVFTLDGGSFRWVGLPSYSDTSAVYPLGLTRTGDTMVLMNRWAGGGTPTLQQVLTAGSTITANVAIDDNSSLAHNFDVGKNTKFQIINLYGNQVTISDTLKLIGTPAGAIDDSLLTWQPTGNYIRKIDSRNLTRQQDTIALASFGAGGGNAGDTTSFSTSTIYGSFYNDGSDTLIITSIRGVVQGSSASITPTVYYNDSLNVTAGATKLVNSPSALTNTTTGVSSTPDNSKIPPGVWVWVSTGTVTTKPTYFSLTLIGYKKRR